jgi:hypothetical protein
MPRGLALVVLLSGGLSLVAGILFVVGSVQIGGLVNLLSALPFIVWVAWLGMHFLSHQLATA